MKLTRAQRTTLIRIGYDVRKRTHGAGLPDVAEAVAGELFDHPDKYGTADVAAIEISDYAYGVAAFVTRGEDW